MTHSSPGDPEGRRPARKRAALLAEAGRVARVLEILLKRAEFPRHDCTEIVTELGRQERVELQRANGRIEPRKRFKGYSSHPLQEKRPISRLYVDENGKSGLVGSPAFFTLGAVAIAEEHTAAYCTAADEIKREFFGTADITFHEPDMRCRDGPYWFKGNRNRQLEFDQAIEELIKGTSFVVFGAGIRKRAFEEQFIATGVDPYLPTDVYLVAIILLLERYVDSLAASPEKRLGRVEFESQGPKEDAEHQLDTRGPFWTVLNGCQMRRSADGSKPGYDLAQSLAPAQWNWRICSRGICTSGICADCSVTPKRWELFNQRVYHRGDGDMGKFGVKDLPRFRHPRQNSCAPSALWDYLRRKLKAP